jgi:MscS family membrane protein
LNKNMSIRFLILFLIALAMPVAAPVFAQDAEPAAATVEPDPLGRETPRSMVSNLIEALGRQDFERAAEYFEVPTGRQRQTPAEQARAFQSLLDNGGSIAPFAGLSNDASGKTDDELPIEQESVGHIRIEDQKLPILLNRSQEGDHQVWRVSRDTLAQIAAANKRNPAAPEPVKENEIVVAGAPLKDWGLLLGLAVMTFGGLWMLSALAVAGMRKLVPDPAASGAYRFCEAALPPLSLLIAVFVFYNWAETLPVSIVARQALLRYTGIVTVIAVVWFGLRLVDAIAELAIARMQRSGRRQIVSVITLLRRGVKILLLVFSGIGILDTFGIDVTTGIAALGIGGIALALGAQKTVENLVGSVTVIADRPLQVGDFIKVGDVVGTVEDVGIRSTRIRTGERTVVTIPNGDLSARQIENFAPRDRFLFNPTIAIAPDTSSAKLKEAIAVVQGVIAGEKNMAEGGRARLGSINDRAFNIDVYAYIDVKEFDTQVIIRENLYLTIYERLEKAGVKLAFQTRTVLFSKEQLNEVGTLAGRDASNEAEQEEEDVAPPQETSLIKRA